MRIRAAALAGLFAAGFANAQTMSIGWCMRAAAPLEENVKAGAKRLKIFKNFGMTVKDSKGERVHVVPRAGRAAETPGSASTPRRRGWPRLRR